MWRPYTLDSRWFESVLSYFLFSLFIKFSSFVHLLLLFLNLFEEQTTVQNPLKNLRSFASSTTRSVACSASYKITTVGLAQSVDDTSTREGDVNI